MKILFVGNYKRNNGPALVNKNIIKYLPKDTLLLKQNNLLLRLIEIFVKSKKSDVIVFSGLSFMGVVGLIVGKYYRKDMYYIMHGCVRYEDKINRERNFLGKQLEWLYLNRVEHIVCVSERFMNWFNRYYPKFKNKSIYINNGVDWELLNKSIWSSRCSIDPNALITMGGGRPQKNNLILAEAIQYLNDNKGTHYSLIVLGEDGLDTEAIKKIKCVKYIGSVKQQEALEYLLKSKLFIQNSTLETFGMAVMEALLCGCDVLVSKNVGALSIIHTIRKDDIIYHCKNRDEIADKITGMLKQGNNLRLVGGIDRRTTSYEYAVNKLLATIYKNRSARGKKFEQKKL